jgi:hypothetical protein
MSRYTFICEQFDYDEFTGDKIGVSSKTTKEFNSEELDVILENFESFLKASGFRFNGHLEIVEEDENLWGERWNDSDDEEEEEQSSRVIEHMMNDLQKNPVTMKDSSLEDEFGDVFVSNEKKCELCKLPVAVMQVHQCFDPKCPCGAYRNQYAD